jgi:hypothetical protein
VNHDQAFTADVLITDGLIEAVGSNLKVVVLVVVVVVVKCSKRQLLPAQTEFLNLFTAIMVCAPAAAWCSTQSTHLGTMPQSIVQDLLPGPVSSYTSADYMPCLHCLHVAGSCKRHQGHRCQRQVCHARRH